MGKVLFKVLNFIKNKQKNLKNESDVEQIHTKFNKYFVNHKNMMSDSLVKISTIKEIQDKLLLEWVKI